MILWALPVHTILILVQNRLIMECVYLGMFIAFFACRELLAACWPGNNVVNAGSDHEIGESWQPNECIH